MEMFLREARAAASLVHPHVVTVHNIGEAEGYHFLEMEYVAGQSLQRVLAAQRMLTTLEATDYLLQSCSALAQAHRQGMVHRDFKPSNILVRQDGIAKLADFGLAKRVVSPSSPTDRGLTGTPYYMAPELFHGWPGSKASDVYAVGVSYYYLLTGNFPFKHRNIARLATLHARQLVPDPRAVSADVPDSTSELIQRAMAKDPGDRFADATELHAALQRVYDGFAQPALPRDGSHRRIGDVPAKRQRWAGNHRLAGDWSDSKDLRRGGGIGTMVNDHRACLQCLRTSNSFLLSTSAGIERTSTARLIGDRNP